MTRTGTLIRLLCALLLGSIIGCAIASTTATDTSIRDYQHQLSQHPGDYRLYLKLGSAYMQKAREGGDATYYDEAERAFRRSLELKPEGNFQAHVYLAAVYQAKHQFSEAMIQAEQAVEIAPTDSYAYGLLGDAYLEVGHYAAAEAAYDTMLRLEPSLFSYSRVSRFEWLLGDPDAAADSLHRALAAGKQANLPQEHLAWAQSQLAGVYFSGGRLQDAETQYEASLTTYPGYHVALAGVADIQAARGHDPEAIRLYERALDTARAPHYAAALGDLYRKVGRMDDAERRYDQVEQIASRGALNAVLFRRTLAYFYADHDRNVAQALELARLELEARRDIYAYDLLAWALYKDGRFEEALAAMTEALKLGTKDARLFFHAGMIHARLRHAEQSTAYLTRALETNPYFHLFHADVARTTLGELTGSSRRPAGRWATVTSSCLVE